MTTALTSALALLLLTTSPLARQSALPPIRATAHVSGLDAPVAVVQDPGDRQSFYVVEQGGRIRFVSHRSVAGDFLDLRSAVATGGERGLLGLALAPDFASSGRFFVDFTNPSGDTVIARFRRTA